MGAATAKRVIILAAVVAVVVHTVTQLRRDLPPSTRQIAGAAIAAVLLAMLAEVTPDIAGLLALTMLVTVLLGGSLDTLAVIDRLTGRSTATPGAPAGGAAPPPQAR